MKPLRNTPDVFGIPSHCIGYNDRQITDAGNFLVRDATGQKRREIVQRPAGLFKQAFQVVGLFLVLLHAQIYGISLGR